MRLFLYCLVKKICFAALSVQIICSVACNKGGHLSQPSQNGAPVITNIAPASGAYNTSVTISGKNFSSNVINDTVRFNNKLATILSAKVDTLIVLVPISAGTGTVTVTVNNRTAIGATFNYLRSFVVSTLAGTGVSGHRDGPGNIAQFNLPEGIAVDNQYNVYVGDSNFIRKIGPDGFVSTLAGSSIAGYLDGRGDTARFSSYLGIAVDQQGNVFIADRNNECIRKVTSDGMVSTFAGSTTQGYLDSVGTNAKFWEPWDVAIDLQRNLYVTDRSNQRIRKITPSGFVSTLAGDGNWGYLDGQGLTAKFFNPYGIAVDGQGNVYVADNWNRRIRKISPTGAVTTVAGNAFATYADGVGTNASFTGPYGICVDAQGNITVSDEIEELIRSITPAGVVSTLAGTYEERGLLDGPANKAKFYAPHGIAVDLQGNIYVADWVNRCIRKISLQ
jgi:sugar lactone lactonase YvrE